MRREKYTGARVRILVLYRLGYSCRRPCLSLVPKPTMYRHLASRARPRNDPHRPLIIEKLSTSNVRLHTARVSELQCPDRRASLAWMRAASLTMPARRWRGKWQIESRRQATPSIDDRCPMKMARPHSRGSLRVELAENISAAARNVV